MAEPGDLVAGRYRLLALLGEGGMGAAWRARDERLRREVAVKQLKLPPMVDVETRAELVRRMQREAQAAAALRNPGIVTVHDLVDDADGLPWIVMDLVPGRSLDQVVRDDGRLAVERVARVGAEVADALAAAHAAGIVHRDVKPANILLETDGRALVTDFGIAAMDGATRITRSGMVVGTPAYMAPEQLEGQQATPAWDVWSLGAAVYFAVEGRNAFTGFRRDEPAPMAHAGRLHAIIGDLMSEDPSHRPTATQAAKRLRQGPVTDSTDPSPAWDHPTQTGQLTGHEGWVDTVAFSPDGRTLVTGGNEPTVRLWDVEGRSQIGQLTGHKKGARQVAFSPDGRTLATCANDGTVWLWDVESRSLIGRLTGHKKLHAVAFSPEGRTLATGGDDEPLRLWDVGSRSQIGQLTGPARMVAFSPDGRTLATNHGGDGTVRLWGAESRSQISQLTVHKDFIGTVAFSPDGRTLATGGHDKTVRLWMP